MYPAGYVVLYSPLRTIIWCIRNGYLPWPRVYFDLLISISVWIVAFSSYSHALQSMGNGYYVHTRLGVVRNETKFPPGYLESAIVLKPKNWSVAIEGQFRTLTGQSNPNFGVLILTPFLRWAYHLGLISKEYRRYYPAVQCASMIAWAWKRGGVDLLADKDIPYVGMYPSDFLSLSQFK